MELEIDSSLEIRSAPVKSYKKRKKKVIKRQDNHIDELVMIALQRFFENKKYADILWNQLGEHKSPDSVSLRVIDWFVTNYSKKHAVHFNVKGTNRVCIVWQEYKQKLRGYSKQRFDPFCRHSRIRFHLGKERSIITTVGQLNFFRWAIENDILEYVKKNKESIEKDMNQTYQVHYSDRQRPDIKRKINSPKEKQQTSSEKKRRKRREITKVANSGICMYKVRS